MFLDKTITENKKLVDYTLEMHQLKYIAPDSYVIDVDQVIENGKNMVEVANNNGVKLYFMLKQIGRNPYIAKRLMEIGFDGVVVVDFKEALVMIEHGIKIGNVGHLVQTPKIYMEKILKAKPSVYTIFSYEIAEYINNICAANDLVQDVILKVIDLDNDQIYEGQFGGFQLSELDFFVKKLMTLKNINIVGITSFPCILVKDNELAYTANVNTIKGAKLILEHNGIVVEHINLPSATTCDSIPMIKNIGGTHGEPGHGLTGTTPEFNRVNNGEKIAMLYLSEISHTLNGNSFCYGGGHYRRSMMENCFVYNQNKLIKTKVEKPSDQAIDYYFQIKGIFDYGDSVLMNFRTQIFVTRSDVYLVEGLKVDKPKIIGVYSPLGVRYE